MMNARMAIVARGPDGDNGHAVACRMNVGVILSATSYAHRAARVLGEFLRRFGQSVSFGTVSLAFSRRLVSRRLVSRRLVSRRLVSLRRK